MSVLFNGIIVMAFMLHMVIEVAAGGPGIFLGILYFLYGLGRIIPRLAVSTRRLNEEAQRGGSTTPTAVVGTTSLCSCLSSALSC